MNKPLQSAAPRVVLLSGNTHRPSKSQALAGFLGQRLTRHLKVELQALDLISAGRELGSSYLRSELPAQAQTVLASIETADALIVTTPVYKGSYPGLFKHLIDLLSPAALAGKPVLIGATGGGHRHALVVEHQLRPLFAFFAAQTGAYSVYASDSEFLDGVPADAPLLERIDLAVEQFASLLDRQFAAAEPLSPGSADLLLK